MPLLASQCASSQSDNTIEGSLTVELVAGVHHDVPALETTCLVFAPNAGLPAFASWAPTMQGLARAGRPKVVLTGLCEEAAFLSLRLLQDYCGVGTPELIAVNAFHCPAFEPAAGNLLPALRNAFIFGFN